MAKDEFFWGSWEEFDRQWIEHARLNSIELLHMQFEDIIKDKGTG